MPNAFANIGPGLRAAARYLGKLHEFRRNPEGVASVVCFDGWVNLRTLTEFIDDAANFGSG
jgi:hypothetical protein